MLIVSKKVLKPKDEDNDRQGFVGNIKKTYTRY